ncbi:MAG: helix-turn-helix transcriptional regulator [Clostridia bacterium]|nr:helix-turn-helix transcriptional regulator [Clostridia bacterium]
MDQVKIGKFIAFKRKELNLTQKELAEKIEVTDKSISKWERGNGLPDTTRLKPLCDALNISMNELVAGEEINETGYSTKAEETIMNLMKENETHQKNSKMQYIIGVCLVLLTLCLLGLFVKGSSAQLITYYIDVPSLLFILLFIGIGVMFGKDKSKRGIFDMIQKLSMPSGLFIALFQLIIVFSQYQPEHLGPSLNLCILSLLYSVSIYMLTAVVKTYIH